MKINPVKFIIAIIIAALVGVICYSFASELDNRQWISLATTTVTLSLSLIMAIGVEYNCGPRNTNISLVAWIMVVAVAICNIVFNCFIYPIFIYVATTLLLSVVVFLSVYSLVSSQKQEEADKKLPSDSKKSLEKSH